MTVSPTSLMDHYMTKLDNAPGLTPNLAYTDNEKSPLILIFYFLCDIPL